MNDARRRFLSLLLSGSAVGLLPAAGQAAPLATTSLQPKTVENAFRRYVAVVEVEGELKLNADGKGVKTQPLTVTGNYEFDEKVLAVNAARPARVLRHFAKAEADIHLGKAKIKNALRDDHRLMGVQLGSESATLYSPLGPLTRDELGLLKIAGEPIVWSHLLPTQPVKPGAKWKPSNETLAILLGIEVITANEVEATFSKLEGTLALVELAGTVSGAVGGVSTDIDVRAKLNYDTKRQFISWLALGLKEKRAIGHAEPGFETKSRVRISSAPLASSGYFAPSVLKDLTLTLGPGSTLLVHDSQEGAFEFLHDRRWHVMTDHRESTILRLIDNGDLIAQCNISRLPNQPAGKQLALDAYQQEVTATLGKNFGQLVDADASQSERGMRQLRVVAAGEVQEVPVQWIYYHLSDASGRTVALVFTMDARLAERFAELDRALIDSMQLRPRAIDGESTTDPQEQPQEAPAEPVAEKPATSRKK